MLFYGGVQLDLYGPPEPIWVINNRRRLVGQPMDPYYRPGAEFGPYSRGLLVPVSVFCFSLLRSYGDLSIDSAFLLVTTGIWDNSSLQHIAEAGKVKFL